MFLRYSLGWWYRDGFIWIWQKAIGNRLASWYEYFSVSDLVRTLFAPYKQTFVGSRNSGKFQAWIDRSISRLVGFITRLVLLIAWFLCSVLVSIIGMLITLLWPLLPVFPIVSIVAVAVRG